MNKAEQYYIRFYAPGSFAAYTFEAKPVVFGWNVPDWQNIDTQDLMIKLKTDNQLIKGAVWPQNAYAFQIYIQIFPDEPERTGMLYYHPKSRVENLKEVTDNQKADPFLVTHMKKNKWEEIVWTRWNTALPFDTNRDRILSA